jgi:hypothetical protein
MLYQQLNRHAEKAIRVQQKKTARTQQEEGQIAGLRPEFNRAFAQRQEELDKAYSHSITEISDEQRLIPPDGEPSPENALDQIEKLAQRLRVLQEKSPDVTVSLKRTGESVAQEIDVHRGRVRERIRRDNALQNLFAAIPNWTNYHSTLRQFVADFPEYHSAGDADAVLKEWTVVKDTSDLLHESATVFSAHSSSFPDLQKTLSLLKINITDFRHAFREGCQTFFDRVNKSTNFSKSLPTRRAHCRHWKADCEKIPPTFIRGWGETVIGIISLVDRLLPVSILMLRAFLRPGREPIHLPSSNPTGMPIKYQPRLNSVLHEKSLKNSMPSATTAIR